MYDYRKVDYKGIYVKITIICKTHGLFEQTPKNHFNSKGCPKCAGNTHSDNKTFIHKSKLVHGERYDYSKVNYVNNRTNVSIICSLHGTFNQIPSIHLQGSDCPGCVDKTKTLEQFINSAKAVHGNKYNYSKVVYVNNNTKVILTCNVHDEFEQKPYVHLNGSGCPACAKYGFNTDKPAILYYLKITTNINQTLYKIGITNRTVKARFSLTDLAKIEIVKQKLYENGQDAWDWEQKLLKLYKQFQYTGPDVLESGNTELFTEDIIAIYYKI